MFTWIAIKMRSNTVLRRSTRPWYSQYTSLKSIMAVLALDPPRLLLVVSAVYQCILLGSDSILCWICLTPAHLYFKTVIFYAPIWLISLYINNHERLIENQTSNRIWLPLLTTHGENGIKWWQFESANYSSILLDFDSILRKKNASHTLSYSYLNETAVAKAQGRIAYAQTTGVTRQRLQKSYHPGSD